MDIQTDYWLPSEVLNIFDMTHQVGKALFYCTDIFPVQFLLSHATMILQCPYCGHYHDGGNWQSGFPAEYVKELFSAQISAEPCLCNLEICHMQSKPGRNKRRGSVGDVCKRSAVNNSRVSLNSLDKVWLYRVLEQYGHGALGIQVPAIYRVTVNSEANKGISQH